MPKMKTKSSAKKRFRFTASGKVKAGSAFKRHGMIKRNGRFLRNSKGSMILFETDGKNVRQFYMPYGG